MSDVVEAARKRMSAGNVECLPEGVMAMQQWFLCPVSTTPVHSLHCKYWHRKVRKCSLFSIVTWCQPSLCLHAMGETAEETA